jgi:hypothetical protein
VFDVPSDHRPTLVLDKAYNSFVEGGRLSGILRLFLLKFNLSALPETLYQNFFGKFGFGVDRGLPEIRGILRKGLIDTLFSFEKLVLALFAT